MDRLGEFTSAAPDSSGIEYLDALNKTSNAIFAIDRKMQVAHELFLKGERKLALSKYIEISSLINKTKEEDPFQEEDPAIEAINKNVQTLIELLKKGDESSMASAAATAEIVTNAITSVTRKIKAASGPNDTRSDVINTLAEIPAEHRFNFSLNGNDYVFDKNNPEQALKVLALIEEDIVLSSLDTLTKNTQEKSTLEAIASVRENIPLPVLVNLSKNDWWQAWKTLEKSGNNSVSSSDVFVVFDKLPANPPETHVSYDAEVLAGQLKEIYGDGEAAKKARAFAREMYNKALKAEAKRADTEKGALFTRGVQDSKVLEKFTEKVKSGESLTKTDDKAIFAEIARIKAEAVDTAFVSRVMNTINPNLDTADLEVDGVIVTQEKAERVFRDVLEGMVDNENKLPLSMKDLQAMNILPEFIADDLRAGLKRADTEEQEPPVVKSGEEAVSEDATEESILAKYGTGDGGTEVEAPAATEAPAEAVKKADFKPRFTTGLAQKWYESAVENRPGKLAKIIHGHRSQMAKWAEKAEKRIRALFALNEKRRLVLQKKPEPVVKEESAEHQVLAGLTERLKNVRASLLGVFNRKHAKMQAESAVTAKGDTDEAETGKLNRPADLDDNVCLEFDPDSLVDIIEGEEIEPESDLNEAGSGDKYVSFIQSELKDEDELEQDDEDITKSLDLDDELDLSFCDDESPYLEAESELGPDEMEELDPDEMDMELIKVSPPPVPLKARTDRALSEYRKAVRGIRRGLRAKVVKFSDYDITPAPPEAKMNTSPPRSVMPLPPAAFFSVAKGSAISSGGVDLKWPVNGVPVNGKSINIGKPLSALDVEPPTEADFTAEDELREEKSRTLSGKLQALKLRVSQTSFGKMFSGMRY